MTAWLERSRRGRRRAAITGLSAVLVVSGAGGAWGYWTPGEQVAGDAAASAATVNGGSVPRPTVSDRRNVVLGWDATTLSDGSAVDGYTIRRFNADGTALTVLDGCSGTVTTTSCTESALPDGVWTYTVTPRVGSAWVGAESNRSASVRTDSTPPVNDITRNADSGGSFRSTTTPTTFFYRGAAAGSLRLVNALTDAGSGPAESVTGQLAGTTTGFSHTASSTTTPAGGPFVSNPISWTAGTTSEPTLGVAGRDAYGNTAATTLTFRLDNDAPTGGALSYADGPTSATTITVSTAAVDDALSGVASRALQVATASLSGNTCGSFGAFSTTRTNPTASVSLAITAGTCYRYQYVLTDNVGNTRTVTSTSVVKARSYAAVIANTTGVLNHWRLGGGSSTTMTATVGSTNGTFFGGPTFGTAGAIAGDTDTAVTFDGTDDYAQATRTIAGNFSIELWFRSSQGLGTTNNWYNGAALFDADTSGVANDFGVSLMADGRVAAGTGNPDTTVLSAAGFNDNAWHHVVMTRTQSNGAIELWIDGTRRNNGTGNTNALNATANVTIGRAQPGGNFYRGAIDEVALYNQALPAATITNHFQSGRP